MFNAPHASALSAPLTCHAKESFLLRDNHTDEAPQLLCHAVRCQGMVHLLPDDIPIRDVQGQLAQAAPQWSLNALCFRVLRRSL